MIDIQPKVTKQLFQTIVIKKVLSEPYLTSPSKKKEMKWSPAPSTTTGVGSSSSRKLGKWFRTQENVSDESKSGMARLDKT